MTEKNASSDRHILLFFYRKQFIQLKPIRAMISKLSDRIWGRLGLSAVRAVPLEEPRTPSAKAAVTELRPRRAAWTRELRLRPLPTGSKTCWQFGCPSSPRSASRSTRPAVNDEDEDEDRVELTHYFLRLAPWIVRPASPSARAGTMMAAIRTKFEVALERSRFPESDWTVVGITAAYLLTAPSQQLADMPAPPKERPRPGQEEGHLEPSERGPPLLHVARPYALPRGRRAHLAGAEEDRELLGLLLLPRDDPLRTPPSALWPTWGWTSLACRRTAPWASTTSRPSSSATPGGWRSSSSCGSRPCGRTGWSTTTSSSSAPRAARPAHRAASPAQRPLQPDPQLPGASRQGLTLRATPTNTGGCAEYKCPRRPPGSASQCYRETAERTLRYRGKASAEFAPLTCYADLEVDSTPAPTVHIACATPSRPLLLRGRRPMRLRATRGAEADHYLTWRRTRPVSMTRRKELEHRAASASRPSRPPRRSSTTATAPGSISGRCATPATSRPRLVVFHNGGGHDFHFLAALHRTMGSPVSRRRAKSSARTATTRAPRARQKAPKAKVKAKAKAKAAPKPLTGWCALQTAIKQGDCSHLCLRVLCKLGKKCLQMSWGPLRFVDSMNVFPEPGQQDQQSHSPHPQAAAGALPADGLASPRAAAARADGLSAPTASLEQAWDCILRGAEAWEMPAVCCSTATTACWLEKR